MRMALRKSRIIAVLILIMMILHMSEKTVKEV